jgi:hypothetical protein
MRLNINSAGIAGKDTVPLQLTRCIRVWPETAICLYHRSSSASWAMGALSDFAITAFVIDRLGRIGR